MGGWMVMRVHVWGLTSGGLLTRLISLEHPPPPTYQCKYFRHHKRGMIDHVPGGLIIAVCTVVSVRR